jgi:hypothetical protein
MKKTLEEVKTSHVHGLAESSNVQIQCNFHQNPHVILHGNRKISPKIHMEA